MKCIGTDLHLFIFSYYPTFLPNLWTERGVELVIQAAFKNKIRDIKHVIAFLHMFCMFSDRGFVTALNGLKYTGDGHNQEMVVISKLI